MMFIVRSNGSLATFDGVQVKASRKTPAIVADGTGKTDYFCVADADTAAALREQGLAVVELHDGWYATDDGGGVGIFGHARYWEVRDTLFSVKEAAGPAGTSTEAGSGESEQVNVRGAIFGV
jgi:hypothetical protein